MSRATNVEPGNGTNARISANVTANARQPAGAASAIRLVLIIALKNARE